MTEHQGRRGDRLQQRAGDAAKYEFPRAAVPIGPGDQKPGTMRGTGFENFRGRVFRSVHRLDVGLDVLPTKPIL